MTNVSHRAVLASATLALASCAGAAPTPFIAHNVVEPPRPNILWLVSKDNNPLIGA